MSALLTFPCMHVQHSTAAQIAAPAGQPGSILEQRPMVCAWLQQQAASSMAVQAEWRKALWHAPPTVALLSRMPLKCSAANSIRFCSCKDDFKGSP